MSEAIPESIPTSQDPRSRRPLKRRALTPVSQQASQVDALFAKPEQDIKVPSSDALTKKSSLAPPPEIVANVQGSSAGAGSGEFHVYKASRRREYERLKLMDEELAREEADAEFENKRLEQKTKDDEKTEKNRRKREKQRQKKGGKGKTKSVAKENVPDNSDREEDRDSKKNDEVGGNDNIPANTAEDVGVIIHDDD